MRTFGNGAAWLGVLLALGLAHPGSAEPSDIVEAFVDDFSEPQYGRWEAAMGNAWTVQDGEFFGGSPSGDYGKSLTVCDYPLTEGVIEASVRPVGGRSSSIGIVGKYIDRENCWYIRYAYWGIMLMVPGRDEMFIAPYSMVDIDGNRDRAHPPVRLKLVIRDGRVGFFADGVLRAMFEDPLAGRAGRPGLYSESGSFASYFAARRER
jgi:hypothetical protein